MNTPSNATDRLFTAEEVAEYLRVSVGTVYNWVSQRSIPFEKVGSATRFRLSTIDQWIKSHPVEPENGGEAA